MSIPPAFLCYHSEKHEGGRVAVSSSAADNDFIQPCIDDPSTQRTKLTTIILEQLPQCLAMSLFHIEDILWR
ncbi:hypothetical protein TRIUR3_28530 [Triticum urartu]|uniref:Uncharacterized protein n=1 Tax=Triticum urartu TaxID=4572 RepID=M8A3T9_TRIUA|nr:hypothetical protein TRIUR3_28530 [Triticum urartu]